MTRDHSEGDRDQGLLRGRDLGLGHSVQDGGGIRDHSKFRGRDQELHCGSAQRHFRDHSDGRPRDLSEAEVNYRSERTLIEGTRDH